MNRIHRTSKQFALAAALGTLTLVPAAFAHDNQRGNGHEKHRAKAQKAYKDNCKQGRAQGAEGRRKGLQALDQGPVHPARVRGATYSVNDYRDYDLTPPPSGHMWVQPYPQDNTYYMVQLATGLISQISGR